MIKKLMSLLFEEEEITETIENGSPAAAGSPADLY